MTDPQDRRELAPDDVTFLRSLAEYHRRDSPVAAEAVELDELADVIAARLVSQPSEGRSHGTTEAA
jgi:hypothetical protein